jgi:DNA-directed RNA polymerase specialized sigma24 family protein
LTSPVESFVITLGRAARRHARQLRDLNEHDRDDVLASAIAWCWENRASYDPAFSLEQWFKLALSEARSRWFGARKRKKQDAVVGAEEFNESMSAYLPDPTAAAAEARIAAQDVLRKLTPRELKQVADRLNGDRTEYSAQLQRKMGRLRALMPRSLERQKALRAIATPDSDTVIVYPQSPVDRELSKLSFHPRGAKDCPPCWRCMWYYGFKPVRYVQKVTVPADAEVQAAIWETERRKIEIATGVYNG